MTGPKYIAAFLAFLTEENERIIKGLEEIPDYERDYLWRQLHEKRLERRKYLTAHVDQLEYIMPNIERIIAKMEAS